MSTARIAVCEDDPRCRMQTVAMVEKWLRGRSAPEGNVVVFESGQALLDALAEGEQFDLYLLDVLMPGPNGIETGAELRRLELPSEIIYLSSSPDFAVDSYGVGAFFYLLKPVEEGKLFDVLDKAAARLTLRHGASIIVPTSAGDHRLMLDDILYVEYAGRRARYVCARETVESLVLRTNFRDTVRPLLDDGRFCLCGASFAINLRRVRIVDGQTARFTGGVRLSLPRTACAGFKRIWGAYWLKEGMK